MSEPQQVNFQRLENKGYQIRILNDQDKTIDLSLSVATIENEGNDSNDLNEFQIKSGNASTIDDPFPSRRTNYTLHLSTQGSEIEKYINLSDLQGPILVFSVSEEGIQYRTEDRPSTDFNIYNDTDEAREFDIQVTDISSGSKYQDTETVPSGAIYTYINVFDLEKEYKISAAVSNRRNSTTILNSRTNSVSILLQEDELIVDVGER